MKNTPPPIKGPATIRQVHLDHVVNTTNRSGPEVVAALNASLPYFEDLLRARGPFKDLCFRPKYEQGWAMYVAGSGDPGIEAMADRLAHSGALAAALLVRSDEEYATSSEDFRSLQRISKERQKALGQLAVPVDPMPSLIEKGYAVAYNPYAVPRDPIPPLARRMKLDALTALVHGAVDGILDPASVTVEKTPGTLRKLNAFRIVFPAGPLLEVHIFIEFDGLQIWATPVNLTRPDKLPSPLLVFIDISPANEFAWPKEMPTETRIACFLRALALFAAQIARQRDTDPQAASDAP
jgi:hypothetical protein